MRKGIALFGFLGVAGLVALFAPAPAQDQPKKERPEIEVPYVPTPQKVVDAMLKLAQVKEGEVVYDLGCGDGRIAITAVKNHKAKKGLGIDFNPERLKDCQENLKKLPEADQKKLEFKQGDVLKMKPEDFKDVDVVTLYLLPEVNNRLQPILKKGLKPGSRVVSHAFTMEGWAPDKEEQIKDDDTHERNIYLWTIKKQ
ncbi:MAG TPA: methyltransferase domain-containing protein [Fimbriiglobus sp.]|jgi:ribosomal protein L11 methylase PrmA|nr:methyltransferase domain-containing protein [Fimbriiglobus sp.]